jgi:hypothetical protein
MNTDMFHLSQTFPGPFLIQNLSPDFVAKLTSGAGTAYTSGALEFTTGFVLLDL